MENKRVIIFGGAGSVGEELVRQLVEKNEVFIFDIDETRFFDLYEELRLKDKKIYGRVADVRNYQTVVETLDEFNPDIVFIASAYKHVVPNEWFPEEAISVNVIGTLNITKAAKRRKIERLVYISTDKVLGESVMGITKKLGEKIVRNAGYTVVRFGNVLGSRGSVIPIWQRQIDRGEPLTITSEKMERYFMTIEEACYLVIKTASIGEPGDVIILDMGKPVKIIDVAKEVLLKLGKIDYNINIIGTRYGEAFTEKLMSDEEEKRAIRNDKFFIIKSEEPHQI